MFYIPLTSTPIGWILLGVSGYAVYKAGKKKGSEEYAASQISEVEEPEKNDKVTKKGEK